MEIKPENNHEEPEYPKREEVSKDEIVKRPLKKWKKAAIAGTVLTGVGIGGILIMNNVMSQTVGGMTVSDSLALSQLEAFNEPFIVYEGKQSGSNVRVLLERIVTHNDTCQDTCEEMMKYNGTELKQSDFSEAKSKISVEKFYIVSFKYNDAGFINDIEVTESKK